jgi:hypothetical protein
MSDTMNASEGTPGTVSLGQPWARNPSSMTDTGDAYQPDAATLRFLRGEPPPEGDWPTESPETATPSRS